MKSFVEHVYDQYPEPLRMEKYMFWRTLRKCFAQHELDFDMQLPEFAQFMQDQYGIELQIVDNQIGPYYNVVDKQKYLIFLLKYQ